MVCSENASDPLGQHMNIQIYLHMTIFKYVLKSVWCKENQGTKTNETKIFVKY
jgi:hypothetical protein